MISAAAFTEFYEQTAAALRRYVARCVGSAGPADDIVQEAYLRLLRHPPPSEDVAQLRAYLFTVASNLMADRWRRHRIEAAPLELEPAPNTLAPDTAMQLDVQRTFMCLRPLDRQLLWLAYVEGASHREIAAALGLREGSIRVLLSRARDKLLQMLEPAESLERSDAARCTALLDVASMKLRTP
jgi:RNA polymerase sigma-70 factor (ECF subfamily)